MPHHVGDEIVAGLVERDGAARYRFNRYKRPPRPTRRSATLTISAHHDVAAAVRRAAVLATAQNRARDLGNRPANDLTPAALADYAAELAAGDDAIAVTVLGRGRDRRPGWARSPPSPRAPSSRPG